ncbi:MAG: hypothetical protein J6A82_02370 [Coprococcus sp.]|nr:hypothetical protein [Coprococcus sp.]
MATAKKTEDAKKVTKATPAAALAKVEAVKKEEAAKKTVAKETVAKETVAKEAAPAKKAAAPAKKAPAKKEAAAKTVEKVFIEFAGGQIEMSAIVDKAKEVIGKKTVKELNVYYQPETGMVYYTADGESGSYSL